MDDINTSVHFTQDFPRGVNKVYIVTHLADGGREFLRADGSRYFEKRGEQSKDEDIVFCNLPIGVDKKFAEELSRIGIKTDNDHKIAGTLEATKYHLEDMRKLAKVTETK